MTKPTHKTKLPVSERALLQRLNRKLRADGEVIKRARGNVWTTLGDYYVVDVERNCIAQHHVDVEDLARELGVLQPWESLQ